MFSLSSLAELDTLDLFIFIGLIFGGIYYIYIKYLCGESEQGVYRPSGIITVTQNASAGSDEGFVTKMKSQGRSVAIFYGSQTGTAEELAGRLAKDAQRYGLKAAVIDPEECEVEQIAELNKSIPDALAIFCVATYGEGDPTDNAMALHEWLSGEPDNLNGLKYAVFGLGNKTYEHFNAMGKLVDKRLSEVGGERVYELGLGDDDSNLEEDFARWRESFWPAVCEVLHVSASEGDVNMRNYRLEVLPPDELGKTPHVFIGEMARLGAFELQRPPYDAKNPFLSNVLENRELHTAMSERSCRHIEFDLTGSRMRYEAGDHAGIFPTNDSILVEKVGELLGADLETVFKLVNLDEDSTRRHPFPCPTTYRTALMHYVDIMSPVKAHLVRELALNWTSDEREKEVLLKASDSKPDPDDPKGHSAYNNYITVPRRGIVDLLQEHKSCRPPIDLVLEMLPRLQVRYYSISSSPKADSTKLAVTAVVLDYNIGNRNIKGVCTNFLKNKIPAADLTPKVPIFVRKSQLRLPHRHHIPVVMVGPGTGFAPYRGFLQDRQAVKEQGKPIGDMLLFFGCRRENEDYIYRDEIEQWLQSGTLTKVYLAFSRQQKEKVYVQHKLWEARDYVWDLIYNKSGHFYVCGDARHMARDVLETMQRMAVELGGMDEKQAADYFKKLMDRERRYQADVWS